MTFLKKFVFHLQHLNLFASCFNVLQLEFYLKSSTGKSYSNIRITQRPYVVGYSAFCSNIQLPCIVLIKPFIGFSLFYILHKYLIAFTSFLMRHIVKN